MTRRRCHWVSPSRRGDKRTPLGALRRSWGHREQLEDFPGEVGAPRHRVTPQRWGCPHSVTPQSWGHPHSVTPQSWGRLHSVTPESWDSSVSPRWCQTPKLGHPKVGVCPRGGSAPTSPPWRHIPKLGTPIWGPILCAPHCRLHCSHGVGAGGTLYFWD